MEDLTGAPESASPSSVEELRAKISELAAAARAAEGAGDVEAAVTRFQKAALLAKSLGEPSLVGEFLVDAAQAFTTIGEFRQAERFLERARELARAPDCDELKGEVYRGYGVLFKARGELDAAAVAFDRALERLEFSARHRSVARVLVELAEVYARQGRLGQASHLFKRAANLPAAAEPALTVRLALGSGRAAYAAGDRETAVAAYRAAREAALASKRPFEVEVASLGLAGLLAEEGKTGESLEALREALALSIVSFSLEGARPVLRARFDVVRKRLLELDVAAETAHGDRALRRSLEDAVRLFNAHPLVLTGEAAPYGTIDAVLGPRAAGTSRAPHAPPAQSAPPAAAPTSPEESKASTRLPNPK